MNKRRFAAAMPVTNLKIRCADMGTNPEICCLARGGTQHYGGDERVEAKVGERKRKRIEGYLPRLLGYALNLANDRDLAQELVQECVLRALTTRRVPGDEPAYRAWLFRILRNAFIDQMRRSSREVGVPLTEPGVDGSVVWNCDERLISALTVRTGLSRLTAPHREIIALVDLAGFSYREAAAFLGVPQGTVMSRLSRARLALLDRITEGNVYPLPVAARRGAR